MKVIGIGTALILAAGMVCVVAPCSAAVVQNDGETISTSAPLVVAQSQKEGHENKQVVREMRSRAKPLSLQVSLDQPVLIMKFDVEDTGFVGGYWSTDEAREKEKRRIVAMLETQIQNRLRGLGFEAILVEDTEEARANGIDLKDAIVIGGRVLKITRGTDHPLISVSVHVRGSGDNGKLYGDFSDGGILGQVTRRIAARFNLSLQ